MYQEAYKQDAGTIVLNLEGLPEDADALILQTSHSSTIRRRHKRAPTITIVRNIQ